MKLNKAEVEFVNALSLQSAYIRFILDKYSVNHKDVFIEYIAFLTLAGSDLSELLLKNKQ